MNLKFSGKIWFWRGPSPWYFVTVPEKQALQLRAVMKTVTYGWGMIPVYAHIGTTKWKTSLFPKNGSYIVPINTAVRKAEDLDEGDTISIRLELR